ncbi:MAG TPA: DUF1127 domain-containing protein [Amaricoccus sp.]|uniref:DUF1127 domain-containing protein n=1 Tax=Amaricoccus sp. TaxID=1872485 RepID=UPI002C97F6E1|nr:DUF1127 domain-containing protein [Amaricoccus sp.]HMQ92737.1 DUF1127 domain-containing protein [Amaricoccus sp.]HMR53715.1 DUF1127 domain-containing protein [Amaricoccus sp.]HMR59758.1 DUF1127 domain-containing protein [Amaricoccus sp.]HMT98944.1 DUF1127 domain-containing protein [Amaricoccus sp.]
MTHAITYPAGAHGAHEDGLVARIGKQLAEWRMYRLTLNELRTLSRRELEDLGIAEADLRHVAREAVRRA